MTKLGALVAVSLLMIGCVGEAADEQDDIATTDDAILQGAETFERPEIGMLRSASSYCTATLVRPNVVLTAAHCIAGGWKDVPIPGYAFEIKPAAGVTKRFEIDRAFTLPVADDFGGPDAQRWRLKDIALMRLATPVPAELAQPLAIATERPRVDEYVAIYGYGCTSRTPGPNGQRPGGGVKRKVGFAWRSTTPGSDRWPNVCPGDSGGPWLDLGSRSVFGTTSGFVGPDDRFGDVPAYSAELDAVADRWSR